jgi:hypothetical protein
MAILEENLKITAMKTRKILLGFLFLLTLGLFSSCDKYDRPAELSIDAQTLEFNNTILTRMFNIVNMGDDLLSVEAVGDKEWISVLGSGVTLSHAQSSVITVHVDTDFFQEFGTYSANLRVTSNGGSFSVPIRVYYFQPDMPKLALDLDYLKFSSTATQDYFTLYNDGAEELDFELQSEVSWLQLTPEIGTISGGVEQRIYVDVDRTGLASGMYAAEINVISNGGDAIVDLDMDVAVYSVTFFNPVYSPIQILTSQFDPVVIEAGERFSFLFKDNPSIFAYSASTRGTTDDGTSLGVEILWEEEINVSSEDSPTYNLNISSDYFFLAVKNTGNYYLDLWSVNYDTDYQIDDDFYIPNDGVEYGVAYYDAFEDTDIYARLSGTSDDVRWSQGIEFVFPWTENQYILLENNFKKSALVRKGLKSASEQQLIVRPFKKAIPKSKGSIDLYNKK